MKTSTKKRITHRHHIPSTGWDAFSGSRKQAFLQGLMNTSMGSVGVYDFVKKKVKYSQWNMLRGLGYEKQDFHIVSKDFFKRILHPDDFEIVQRHMGKITSLRDGQVLAVTFRIRDKEDHYRWILIRDTVIDRNKDGSVHHVMGSIVDITRYRDLKGNVSQNLALLTSMSFRNAHELRGPVATTLGLVSLLKHKNRTEECLEEIANSLETTVQRWIG